jgi:hypothetical protein
MLTIQDNDYLDLSSLLPNIFQGYKAHADATFSVEVINNDPPIIQNCPDNITVYTDPLQHEHCYTNVNWVPPTAMDKSGEVLMSSNYLPGDRFQVGTTTVIYTAVSQNGRTASCSFTVTVIDNTHPKITVHVSPDELWPPNHKMVEIHADVDVCDNCDGVSFVLESITSNEPDNGLGDGDTENDIQGATYNTPDTHFQLRAERSGRGNGRVYTITYKAIDKSGNITRETAYIRVPHNK